MDEEGNESAVYAYAAFVVPLYVDVCTYNGLTQKFWNKMFKHRPTREMIRGSLFAGQNGSKKKAT
jgi:hypothetical protein